MYVQNIVLQHKEMIIYTTLMSLHYYGIASYLNRMHIQLVFKHNFIHFRFFTTASYFLNEFKCLYLEMHNEKRMKN